MSNVLWTELTKSVVAACTDAREVMIQTHIRKDVNTEQANMAAGNSIVRLLGGVPNICHSAWHSCDLSWQTAVLSYQC